MPCFLALATQLHPPVSTEEDHSMDLVVPDQSRIDGLVGYGRIVEFDHY
jgi:hypothetical protein